MLQRRFQQPRVQVTYTSFSQNITTVTLSAALVSSDFYYFCSQTVTTMTLSAALVSHDLCKFAGMSQR